MPISPFPMADGFKIKSTQPVWMALLGIPKPKIGHTFTDAREVVVEVPKEVVQRKSESIKECLREVVALGLARSAALGTFSHEAERAIGLYHEDPPIWYYDRRPSRHRRATLRP
jgi:hypothetical protein